MKLDIIGLCEFQIKSYDLLAFSDELPDLSFSTLSI